MLYAPTWGSSAVYRAVRSVSGRGNVCDNGYSVSASKLEP